MLLKLIKSINNQEWRFIIAVIIFVILITTLPYLYGYLKTPADSFYTGLHAIAPADIHVYFSYIEQTRQGHLFFEDLYTSEPQARNMFNIFWLAIGLIAKFFSLSNILVFQLARLLLAPIFIFLLYLLAAYFWADKTWRRVAFIFFVFASGLGAIISVFLEQEIYSRGWYNWPLDLWADRKSVV
jgi:hypothetical protein